MSDPTALDRFDMLLCLIHMQAEAGEDVLLDNSDARLLLQGFNSYTRCKRATSNARELELSKARVLLVMTARQHRLPVATLTDTANRTRAATTARRAAVRAIKEGCPTLSTTDIGLVVNAHHTTVLNALDRLGSRTCQKAA